MLECRRGSPVEIHISMVEVTRMHRRTAGSQAEMEEEVMVVEAVAEIRRTKSDYGKKFRIRTCVRAAARYSAEAFGCAASGA
jgi:hypothetical protein